MAVIYIWAGQVYSVCLQKSLHFPLGKGFSDACFTLADDSAIMCFPFNRFFFFVRYWLLSTGVIKKQLGAMDTDQELALLGHIVRKGLHVII